MAGRTAVDCGGSLPSVLCDRRANIYRRQLPRPEAHLPGADTASNAQGLGSSVVRTSWTSIVRDRLTKRDSVEHLLPWQAAPPTESTIGTGRGGTPRYAEQQGIASGHVTRVRACRPGRSLIGSNGR